MPAGREFVVDEMPRGIVRVGIERDITVASGSLNTTWILVLLTFLQHLQDFQSLILDTVINLKH